MKFNHGRKVRFISWVVYAVVFIAVVLGIMGLLWNLWTWVFPQIWPTGPVGLINPGYWLFCAMWLLASIILGMIFRREK